jgi:hypothetical protein
VQPWSATPGGFIVFPHDPANVEKPLSQKALSRGGDFEKLGTWFKRFKPILAKRAAPPNRNWKLDGDDWLRLEGPFEHMRSGHLVVVREIAGAPAAAVVQKRWNDTLQRSETPLVEHKLLFCSVETEDEAIYLAAFINSTPAQDFLSSFTSKVGVTPKALRTIPIPEFEKKNTDVALMIAAGRRILEAGSSDRASRHVAELPGIDLAVLRLVEYAGDYKPQVRRQPAAVKKVDSILALEFE